VTDSMDITDELAFFSLLISLRYVLMIPFSAYQGSSSRLELFDIETWSVLFHFLRVAVLFFSE
jgi:hypothetical protein